jgi:hypothetical protein
VDLILQNTVSDTDRALCIYTPMCVLASHRLLHTPVGIADAQRVPYLGTPRCVRKDSTDASTDANYDSRCAEERDYEFGLQ